MGSFSHRGPIAATHVGRDYSDGKSRNKKGLSRSARQQSQTQRRVCGSGDGRRAASGKAKLVPHPPPPPRGNEGSHFSRV